MKNKLFLVACGVVLSCICAHSAYAAAGRKITYTHHFNGSGWNTPYHVVGTCNRYQYNEYNFGGKYRFDVVSALGNKSFSVQCVDEYNGPILTNVSTTMPTSVMTFTVNKNNTSYTKDVYAGAYDAESISIKFKKPFTATWSYDLEVDTYPFYND